jgi:hypothetical protein
MSTLTRGSTHPRAGACAPWCCSWAVARHTTTASAIFTPQAQRTDAALGAALEAIIFAGTLDCLRAGQRALMQQRGILVRFFDRYLQAKPWQPRQRPSLLGRR